MRRLVLILLALALTGAPVYGDEQPDQNHFGERKSSKELYEDLIKNIYFLGELRKNLNDHEKMKAIFRAAENENKGEWRKRDSYQEGLVAFKRKEYQKAAEQGNHMAQVLLGELYFRGEGVIQNYKEAVKWYRKAAERGNPEAQYNFGKMYLNGQGVPQNYIEAHKWFNIAGANGWEEGQKYRDEIQDLLTREQIAEAQKRAREWMEKHEK